MRIVKWFDCHLWTVPLALLTLLQLVHVPAISARIPTIGVTEDQRLAILTSIAGTFGTFSGLALAVVAILASPASPRAVSVEKARLGLALLMLIESLLFLLTTLLAVILIPCKAGIGWQDVLLTLIIASLTGLLVGGVAFALAIIESHTPSDH